VTVLNEQAAYLTKELVQLMINTGIDTYDTKVSLPRHLENKESMKGMEAILDKVCTVLTKIEGGFTAFKWIGGIVAFAWTLTEIAHAALNVVETLHKAAQ
jgi:hypothetical protein